PPIEGFVCIAEFLPENDGYDVISNFPGPFGMHSVMAWSLRVPGNKLRMRSPPNAGGNFGVKLTMFPSIVVMCVASKLAGRPVKWVEDRLEHLVAANSAPNRVTRVEAAYTAAGEVTALRLEHWDDHGGHIRAPMPGPIFRMHGTTSNAYKLRHLDVTVNIVVTNKCPSGAVRGFGGPQLYYATERLMQRIAVVLDLDPLEVLRRNILPADVFPYRAPAGAVYDSGNYGRCIDEAVAEGRLEDLKRRREEVRAQGKYYGIGYAVGIEPSQSNMGYIAIAKSAEKRKKSGPKDGAIVYATVSVDASGSINVVADSVPQGQGHATTLSQIVADQLGVAPEAIMVNTDLDTQKDAWSIASGNYSSRFAAAVGSATHLAAQRVRAKLARIASGTLNRPAEDLVFSDSMIRDPDNPDNAVPLYRIAALAHWSPGSLPEGMEPGMHERAAWSAKELEPSNELGEINCELAYGFIFDFCGVEIDPVTFDVKVDRYVTAHDCGTVLNPALLEGQVGGSFAAGFGAALYEEFVYGEDGAFYSGSFADYLIATAAEMPPLDIVHCTPSPSPVTLLGAKGVGEGNTYTTPVCIANAVADALGIDDVVLPVTPSRVADLLLAEEQARVGAPESEAPEASGSGRSLTGEDSVIVPAPPEEVWRSLLDPDSLAAVIPGCRSLETAGENRYRASVDMGVGPVRGRFQADVRLFDLEEPRKAKLEGSLSGPLGSGSGSGEVHLEACEGGTRVSYSYRVKVAGKVAAVGGRMLDGAARSLIQQFFRALVSQAGGPARRGLWSRLRERLGLSS
ncbi:MAG: molybdopterin cofactor-binding domain-containing protein, partial [Rhodovibrionaceae bacterium]